MYVRVVMMWYDMWRIVSYTKYFVVHPRVQYDRYFVMLRCVCTCVNVYSGSSRGEVGLEVRCRGRGVLHAGYMMPFCVVADGRRGSDVIITCRLKGEEKQGTEDSTNQYRTGIRKFCASSYNRQYRQQYTEIVISWINSRESVPHLRHQQVTRLYGETAKQFILCTAVQQYERSFLSEYHLYHTP